MTLKTENKLVIGFEAAVSEDGRLAFFKRIYEENRTYAHKTVYWLVRNDAVDDLVQDIFLKVWRNLDRFRENSSIRTWLYRISVNSAYEYFRRNPNHSSAAAPQPNVENPTTSSVTPPITQEDALATHQLIRNGILLLPPKQRSVFVLFYKQELSVEEIAETLRLPRGTVKSRLFHARNAFIQYLEAHGVNYENA